jgi:hypothetical protein
MLSVRGCGIEQSLDNNRRAQNKYFVNLRDNGSLELKLTDKRMPYDAGSDEEDTPALAVARYKEVEKLGEILIKLTKDFRKIQEEPSKALCRFLFSSKLAEPKNNTSDPLLSSLPDGHYDKSICLELKDKPEYAHKVCDKLCTASILAVRQLKILKTKSSPSEVKLLRDKEKWRVSWGDASICIEDGLLRRLQRMYRETLKMTDNAQLDQNFNRRLFCILMRYKSLGGQDNMITKGGGFHEASKLFSSVTWAAFRDLGVTKECTASPFNSSAPTFWSAFADTDCFFGSKGNFFDASDTELREGGSFMADGPPVEETLELLERRIHKVLEQNTNPTSFVVGYPPWRDMDCWKNLRNSKYLVFHLDNCIVDHFGHMSLFILQNTNGRETWPVTPAIKMKLRHSFGIIGKS